MLTDRPVHSPLNLTVLLYLIVHLSEMGYPAHWLSGVLAALCRSEAGAASFTTTARPPRRSVISPLDVDAVFPSREIDIAPWREEFSTLISLWAGLLPFGLVMPPGTMVPPSDIAEYTVTFQGFMDHDPRRPHFVLVFWNVDDAEVPPMSSDELWWTVNHDNEIIEQSDFPTETIRYNLGRFHIFSAVHYTTVSRTATFWSRVDFVDRMRAEDYAVFLWRIDTWTRVSEGVCVKQGVTMKRGWDEPAN